MTTNDRFLDIVDKCLDLNLRNPDNEAQLKAIIQENDCILQIVAGPGSGKTTVLVLRALRFVFVEGVLPENIVITTFTRKAARELRTRWLDWGTILCAELESDPDINLNQIDLNRCRIDTLDSIVQQVLVEYRLPGTLAPVVAETSASSLILKRLAFQDLYVPNQDVFDTLLSRYTFDGNPPRNRGDALKTTKRLLERLIQDRVNLDDYARSGQAQELIVEVLGSYLQQAIETNIFDFTFLEEQFLKRLSDGSLDEWLEEVKVVLVDEYQDTNPLQEAIYFQVTRRADPSVTIVGDDDQSMYRFRGGSVELFTDFARRCEQATGRRTNRVDMTRNFRSRPEIVQFYNDYIMNDMDFSPARINPPKPLVVATRVIEEIPVLGMFRESEERLANDLATFFYTLINQRRFYVGGTGQNIQLSQDGDLGDAVFLAHSVEEVSYNHYNSEAQMRFPGMLRYEMEANDLQIFNPRGQALRSIPDVGVLLGLLLLSVDPYDTTIDDVRPTNEARFFLNQWRQRAQQFVDKNPAPNDGLGLKGFIEDWQNAALGRVMEAFPQDWPVLELIFKVISWMPEFQRNPEHQVWLEAITRIIASAGMASPYSMQLLQNTANNGDHVRLSRLSFVRDALIPIAENEVDVDEDIIPSVPRDRLQFMTIHQAKGLEFPLVVVDVGSRFKTNHRTQRFLRFPDQESNVARAEDDVEPYLTAPLRGGRRALDRTFDDLVRLYYVAYSRPQSVLMLVGNSSCLRYGTGGDLTRRTIPNTALGWRRDGSWPWRQEYSTPQPPVLVEPPFLLI